MIRRETITVTGAAGGAGLATANTTSTVTINGIIRAIYLEYTDSPPAGTTDVTIAGATSPALEILTVSNAATDGWFYPMWQAVNNSNATITNQGSSVAVDDQIKVTIAQANNSDGVIATIVYEDLSRV